MNAKSIMGIMSLAVGTGTKIRLIADGHDEDKALEALTEFLENED